MGFTQNTHLILLSNKCINYNILTNILRDNLVCLSNYTLKGTSSGTVNRNWRFAQIRKLPVFNNAET